MLAVTLTRQEIARAQAVGKARIALADVDPTRFAYKPGRSGPDTHTLGALAELAASKAIGVPWPARVEDFGLKPDLDPHWEVRWGADPKKVRVSPNDPPDILVCYVTGQPPELYVHGYVVAGAVQRRERAAGNKSFLFEVHRLVPIGPDFHQLCAWHEENGVWVCAYCGIPFN